VNQPVSRTNFPLQFFWPTLRPSYSGVHDVMVKF